MEATEFRTVFAGVRPPRLAVLVDQTDVQWQDTCRRVIECLSSTWGGKYSVLIPTDGSKIDAQFWDILEAFDPDYICEYLKTGLDLKIGSPQRYESLLEQHLQNQWPDQSPPADARDAMDRALAEAPFEAAGVSVELQEELKMRLAPFFLEGDVIQNRFQARSEPRFPLTALSTILPHCQHPDRLCVARTDLDDIPPLWVESILGGTYPEQVDRIHASVADIEPVVVDTGDVYRLMVHQIGRDRDKQLPERLASGPFQLSMVALSEY